MTNNFINFCNLNPYCSFGRDFLYLCPMAEAGTIRAYLNNLEYVGNTLLQETKEILNKKEEQILDLNREDQIFDKGIDIFGRALGNYANDYQGFTRGYPKSQGDRYNLFDTGSLFNSFSLESDGNIAEILNSSWKVGALAEPKGKKKKGVTNFVGLTEANKKKLNYEILLPEILAYCNQYL